MLPAIIIIIVLFVVCVVVSAVIYIATAGILARLHDYAIVKKARLGGGGMLLSIPLGIFLLRWQSSAMIGVGILAALAGYYFIKFKGSFWKVIIANIIALIVTVPHFLSSLISGSGHQAKRRVYIEGLFIEGSTIIKGVQYPDHIRTGNWDMEFVYSLGTAPIYENHDGMRCLVNHKRTLSKYGGGYDFDITPLYNINDPLPGWIRCLY